MTTLCLDDASAALRAELLAEDADTPAPITIARFRDAFDDLIQHATTEPTE